jgi:ATP-dependent DNA helicase 2 subunit 1
MSWSESNQEGEDEQDEEEDEEFKNSNDRIIFLIDARSAMFQPNAQAEIQFTNCLKIALAVMKTKIIAQDASSLGITFFGTREKDSPETAEGVFTLLPLAPPSAARIRQLQTFIKDMDEFHRSIGFQSVEKKSCPLKQALWTCSQAFANDLKKTDFKRIWLFTNDDSPNESFPVEQRATVTVARDCSQAGVEISLWHLNRGLKPFDPKAYYFQLLVATSSDGDDDVESAIDARMLGAGFDGFDSLLASVRRKAYRKRRLGSTLFSLDALETGLGQHMGVQLFNAVQVAKRPLHSWLFARSNEPLKAVTRYFHEATGELLNAEQIDSYIDVGGNHVSVEKEEMEALKATGNLAGVGLRLLCFAPADALTLQHNLSSPYLLYPHEKAVKGSAALFEALLRGCADKKLLPIVRFNRVDKASPRLAALWPQLEEIDEDGCQVQPPAFHLLPLPFVEDCRYCPLAPSAQPLAVPADAQTAADSLVRTLAAALPADFRYDKDLESPAIQQFYAVLQAVALGADALEWQAERDDSLRPTEDMVKLCSGHAQALSQALDLADPSAEGEGGAEVQHQPFSSLLNCVLHAEPD